MPLIRQKLTARALLLTTLAAPRYAVESEMLLRAAALGLRIGFSPVTVRYPAAPDHKSHFRPCRDTGLIVLYHARELVRRLGAALRPAARSDRRGRP